MPARPPASTSSPGRAPAEPTRHLRHGASTRGRSSPPTNPNPARCVQPRSAGTASVRPQPLPEAMRALSKATRRPLDRQASPNQIAFCEAVRANSAAPRRPAAVGAQSARTGDDEPPVPLQPPLPMARHKAAGHRRSTSAVGLLTPPAGGAGQMQSGRGRWPVSSTDVRASAARHRRRQTACAAGIRQAYGRAGLRRQRGADPPWTTTRHRLRHSRRSTAERRIRIELRHLRLR